jgi:hypothetical protein
MHVLLRHTLQVKELDVFLKRQNSNYDHIIYIGDGTNDFCPAETQKVSTVMPVNRCHNNNTFQSGCGILPQAQRIGTLHHV